MHFDGTCSILVGRARSEGATLGRSKAPDALRWGMLTVVAHTCPQWPMHFPTPLNGLLGARGEGVVLWAGGQCTFQRG